MSLIFRVAQVVSFSCICVLTLTDIGNQTGFTQGEDPRTSPAELLRSAKTISIRTQTVYFKPAALEQVLINKEEFQDWDLAIARDVVDADLIIEVDRKLFTNVFVYNVLSARTNMVVAGGKIGSLGGSVEGQIADSFIKKLKKVR
jgi:hypothetical protein